jgi:hypothetical protein
MTDLLFVMTVGAVALVVLSVVGVASAWGLSRLMDRANQKALIRSTRWGEALDRIEIEPLAAGVYYGLRWIGICVLVGWLFSRAV